MNCFLTTLPPSSDCLTLRSSTDRAGRVRVEVSLQRGGGRFFHDAVSLRCWNAWGVSKGRPRTRTRPATAASTRTMETAIGVTPGLAPERALERFRGWKPGAAPRICWHGPDNGL